VYSLSRSDLLVIDDMTRAVFTKTLNMLILSGHADTQEFTYRALSSISKLADWRSTMATNGCLYHMMLGVNSRLAHESRRLALKALVHFANDRDYRFRVGEGCLSSFIKTLIKNPHDEVKVPAVTILAILASNDSYRNRILGSNVLEKVVAYLKSTNDKLRIQSARLLSYLAVTDESRKQAAAFDVTDAIVELFCHTPKEAARRYAAAAIAKLALTTSVRGRLEQSGAIEALSLYLQQIQSNNDSPATRARCFEALAQFSLDDRMREKLQTDPVLCKLIACVHSPEADEQAWALRTLLHLGSDDIGKSKLLALGAGPACNRVQQRSQVSEVKLLAKAVISLIES